MTDTDTDTTDDQMRRLTAQLFGRDPRTPNEIQHDTLTTPEPKPAGNNVPAEGTNPQRTSHTYEDHLRQLALEIFNPDKAATDPAVC